MIHVLMSFWEARFVQRQDDTAHAIRNTSWPTVAIIGLGFIGLPLAMAYARKGSRVIGVDINKAHVKRLQQGKTTSIETYEGHTLEHYLQNAISQNNFIATTDFSVAAREADAFIVTVGIPILDGKPLYDAIDAATDALAKVIKPGDLLLYRSTHIPGTLRNHVIPLLKKVSSLDIEHDVHIAYAPERVAEGRAMEEFQTVDVLVGGLNDASTAHAIEVLRTINQASLHATTIEMAETVKVVENVQRDVNIAMMQEIARFAQNMGLSTPELVGLANTHPRVNLLTPGAGVGGYCIPNAFHYLQVKAEDMGIELPLLAMSRDINQRVPITILDRIERASGWQASTWQGKKVTVLGLAMKNYSNDDRLSPSVALIDELLRREADVTAFDPLVALEPYAYARASLEDALQDAEVVIVTVRQHAWDRFSVEDIRRLAPPCRLIFDACSALATDQDRSISLLRV